MTIRLYDKMPLHADHILLDLPFREGVGAITQDVAKPHHPVTLVNTPTWTSLASDLGCLALNGTNEYLRSLNASTADLGFTAGPYSLATWLYWQAGDDSQIIMGRYELDVGGWEVYLYNSPPKYLTLRHHHAGGAAVRSAVYSAGWEFDTWYFLGISRTGGGDAIHYRNGVPLVMTGSLEDPEATTSDLVIGARYTINDNWFKGRLWRPRAWDRILTPAEWARLYSREAGWFA